MAECLKAEKPSTSSAHSSPHATPWALLKLLKIRYTFDIVLPPGRRNGCVSANAIYLTG